MKVAFIGLGVMGYPMAGHLAKQKFAVTVYNRTFAKAEKWQKQYQMPAAKTPALAAKDAKLVFICINTDYDIEEVVTGKDGILETIAKDAVIIDHSTASASLAIKLAARCHEQGVYFLDAPVSGGQQGAQTGQLAIMVGGEAAAVALARPAMNSFAKQIVHLGVSGMGQYAKMVNQICIAGVLQGLAEGINFAKKSGLDIEKLLQAISKGAAQSWQMENRMLTMSQNKFDFGFAVDLMRKDLNIALKSADRLKAELPLTALIDQLYKKLQNKGGGRLDTSSLIKLLSDEN